MIVVPEERIRDFKARGWWGEETLDDLFRRHVAAMPDAESVVDPINREAIMGGAQRSGKCVVGMHDRGLFVKIRKIHTHYLSELIGLNMSADSMQGCNCSCGKSTRSS